MIIQCHSNPFYFGVIFIDSWGQNPERLPEQAAELERVVRSLQPAA